MALENSLHNFKKLKTSFRKGLQCCNLLCKFGIAH